MRRNRTPIKKRISKKIDLSLKKNNLIYIKNDVNRRSVLRTYGNVDVTKFNKSNNIDGFTVVDYEVVIIIPTINRFENIYNILNDLFTQETFYKFKIIVINDNSNDERYDVLKSFFPEITYLTNDINYGKKKYWMTINKLFGEAQKNKFRYLIQIDDDVKLLDGFINNVINKFKLFREYDSKIICMDYRLYGGRDKNKWGFKYWIDGCGIYDYNFLKKINFKIDEIPSYRWSINKNTSSGVWEQVSKKINDFGLKTIKIDISLVEEIECETQMQK